MKNKILLIVFTLMFILGTPLGNDLIVNAQILEEQVVKKDVPFVPTDEAVVDEMINIANVTKDDLLYDLGSGDGRIVLTAVKKTGCRGVGIDIDPDRIAESQKNLQESGLSGVEFRLGDIFTADIADATVVTMYLLQTVNERLRPRLLGELKPGTRIVSHAFDMGPWKPDKTSTVNGSSIYYWVVPVNISGKWNWEENNGKSSIEITQKFQTGTGKLDLNGKPANVGNIIVEGKNVMFKGEVNQEGKIQPALFKAVLNDNGELEGTITTDGNEIKWLAKRDPGTEKPLDEGKSDINSKISGNAPNPF